MEASSAGEPLQEENTHCERGGDTVTLPYHAGLLAASATDNNSTETSAASAGSSLTDATHEERQGEGIHTRGIAGAATFKACSCQRLASSRAASSLARPSPLHSVFTCQIRGGAASATLTTTSTSAESPTRLSAATAIVVPAQGAAALLREGLTTPTACKDTASAAGCEEEAAATTRRPESAAPALNAATASAFMLEDNKDQEVGDAVRWFGGGVGVEDEAVVTRRLQPAIEAARSAVAVAASCDDATAADGEEERAAAASPVQTSQIDKAVAEAGEPAAAVSGEETGKLAEAAGEAASCMSSQSVAATACCASAPAAHAACSSESPHLVRGIPAESETVRWHGEAAIATAPLRVNGCTASAASRASGALLHRNALLLPSVESRRRMRGGGNGRRIRGMGGSSSSGEIGDGRSSCTYSLGRSRSSEGSSNRGYHCLSRPASGGVGAAACTFVSRRSADINNTLRQRVFGRRRGPVRSLRLNRSALASDLHTYDELVATTEAPSHLPTVLNVTGGRREDDNGDPHEEGIASLLANAVRTTTREREHSADVIGQQHQQQQQHQSPAASSELHRQSGIAAEGLVNGGLAGSVVGDQDNVAVDILLPGDPPSDSSTADESDAASTAPSVSPLPTSTVSPAAASAAVAAHGASVQAFPLSSWQQHHQVNMQSAATGTANVISAYLSSPIGGGGALPSSSSAPTPPTAATAALWGLGDRVNSARCCLFTPAEVNRNTSNLHAAVAALAAAAAAATATTTEAQEQMNNTEGCNSPFAAGGACDVSPPSQLPPPAAAVVPVSTVTPTAFPSFPPYVTTTTRSNSIGRRQRSYAHESGAATSRSSYVGEDLTSRFTSGVTEAAVESACCYSEACSNHEYFGVSPEESFTFSLPVAASVSPPSPAGGTPTTAPQLRERPQQNLLEREDSTETAGLSTFLEIAATHDAAPANIDCGVCSVADERTVETNCELPALTNAAIKQTQSVASEDDHTSSTRGRKLCNTQNCRTGGSNSCDRSMVTLGKGGCGYSNNRNNSSSNSSSSSSIRTNSNNNRNNRDSTVIRYTQSCSSNSSSSSNRNSRSSAPHLHSECCSNTTSLNSSRYHDSSGCDCSCNNRRRHSSNNSLHCNRNTSHSSDSSSSRNSASNEHHENCSSSMSSSQRSSSSSSSSISRERFGKGTRRSCSSHCVVRDKTTSNNKEECSDRSSSSTTTSSSSTTTSSSSISINNSSSARDGNAGGIDISKKRISEISYTEALTQDRIHFPTSESAAISGRWCVNRENNPHRQESIGLRIALLLARSNISDTHSSINNKKNNGNNTSSKIGDNSSSISRDNSTNSSGNNESNSSTSNNNAGSSSSGSRYSSSNSNNSVSTSNSNNSSSSGNYCGSSSSTTSISTSASSSSSSSSSNTSDENSSVGSNYSSSSSSSNSHCSKNVSSHSSSSTSSSNTNSSNNTSNSSGSSSRGYMLEEYCDFVAAGTGVAEGKRESHGITADAAEKEDSSVGCAADTVQ